MSIVTIIWSMTAAASLMLAIVYLFIWIGQREQVAHLAFSMMAVSVSGFAGGELALMFENSPAQYAVIARWMHVPTWVMIVSIVWFTRTYLHEGRPWLAWTVVGLRTLALLVNFALPGSITFREIKAIKQVFFLGEPVCIPVAVPNPWMLLAHGSVLLLLVFLIDASISVSRRGNRRGALIVGGSMVLFTSQGLVQVVLVHWAVIAAPLRVSVGFLLMLIAMALELSRYIRRGARVARQLHEAEQQVRLTVGAAGLGVWSWDILRDEFWATDCARTHLGLTDQAHLRMQAFLEAVHAADRESVQRAIDGARFDGGEYEVEYRISRPDGATRCVALRGSAERTGGGGVLVRGVTMDITERKRTDERFRLTIEASPSAVLLVDREGQVVLANKKTEEYFGYAQGELVGQGFERLVPPSEQAVHSRHRESFFDAPQTRAMGIGRELLARRKDGTEFPVEVGLNPIATEHGLLVLCAIIDISSRRQAELEIAQLRESLSHAGRVSMLGQLASALAHEINQPLGAILRNAEAAELILQQNPPGLDELGAIVADIQKDGQRAGEVIDRLRGLLKRRDVEMRSLSVAALLNETIALMRPYATGLNVKLAIEIRPDSFQVMGDRIHLQQVILNLLLNGIHAVREQTPDRRLVKIKAGLNEPRTAQISVIDRGHGIPPDRLSKIFDPFFTTKEDGMGMGLPISRTIIEAHGGRIWAEHTQDGGATVRFTLTASEGGPSI